MKPINIVTFFGLLSIFLYPCVISCFMLTLWTPWVQNVLFFFFFACVHYLAQKGSGCRNTKHDTSIIKASNAK